jgi:dsRNA-specific ribonuclease
VLQVAVHGEDELARGVVETGRQGRGLAEVAAQLDHQHAAVDRGNLFQQLVGAVVGAVVDQHQLKAVAHLLHHLLQAGIEDGDVFLFIVKRHDDRILRHS